MIAEYDLIEKPNPNGDGEKQLLYPRIVIRDTIRTDRFIERLSQNTTFTESEVKGILNLAAESLKDLLKQGYRVELEEVGYFTPTLTARRAVKEKEEIRSASISIDGVNFLPCKSLKKELRSAPVVKTTKGFKKSLNKYSVEERKVLLENFLSENGVITRKEYTDLTGLLQNKALEELKGWVAEGFLTSKGKRSTLIFLKLPL